MNEYFASKPPKELAGEIVRLTEDYHNHLQTSGKYALWGNVLEAYHKGMLTKGQIIRTGEQSEYLELGLANFRNLLQHLLILATSTRPALDAIAINSDHKSLSQSILGNGLLEFYLTDQKHALEKKLKASVELALLMGEGFLTTGWDATGGTEYEVDQNSQTIIRNGDLTIRSYSPIDVIRDVYKFDSYDHDWYVIRDYENKYTLAAKHPDIAEEIINSSPSQTDQIAHDVYRRKVRFNDTSNDIPVLTFFHKKNEAMVAGRMFRCLNTNTILLDNPLPYADIPVFKIAPDPQVGSTFGYTIAYDLLPICNAIDILASTALTNQATFGVQNVLAPRGSGVTASSLAGGLQLIEYDAGIGKPESMNLTHTPPEVFNFMAALTQVCETVSGVNSVARGQPEASLKSGAALALVQSQAIQFASGLVNSYTQILEDVGTSIISILKEYATAPRIALITGKSNRSYLKEFTKDDLTNIERVRVQAGNPLSRTLAGRTEMANQLLGAGMIEDTNQYITCLTTGRIEPMYAGKQGQLMLIKSENERLMEGTPVIALLTDKHQEHINEHAIVLSSPEAREVPEVVTATLAHITEHITLMSDPKNATLLALLNQQGLPAPAPTPPVTGQPAVLDAVNPVTQEAGKVSLPNLPEPSPLTNLG